jgi:antitoxin YefM
MPIVTSYTDARARLASLLDRAVEDREPILIRRRGSEDVALIAADELESLLETAHLLRSPRNAQRLFESIRQAQEGQARVVTLDQLRAELGLDAAAGVTRHGRHGGGRHAGGKPQSADSTGRAP